MASRTMLPWQGASRLSLMALRAEAAAPREAGGTSPRGVKQEANAAVAVLLTGPPPSIVLLRKTPRGAYGGQLALPGGHVEAGESWAAAARREVLEEVGVEADLGGCLGVFPTSLGHNVAAFAGTFSGELRCVDKDEVEACFLVPISMLCDPALALRRGEFPVGSRVWTGPLFHLDGSVADEARGPQTKPIVWGLTAHILRDFLTRAARAAPKL